MKILFLLFAFASCSVCKVCKTDNPIQKTHNSTSEENYILLKADSNYCGYVNKRITDLDLHTIIDNDSAYDEMIRGCGVVFEKPDFAKYIVLKQTLTGDSIMCVHHAVKKDSIAGTLIWITSSNQFTPHITRRTTYFIKVERPPD